MQINYKTIKAILGSLLQKENHRQLQTSRNVKIQCRKRNVNNIKLEEIVRNRKSGKNAEGLVANVKVIKIFQISINPRTATDMGGTLHTDL